MCNLRNPIQCVVPPYMLEKAVIKGWQAAKVI